LASTVLVCILLAAPGQLQALGAQRSRPLAAGAAYAVNSTADLPDVDSGTSACLTISGTCTLRAAIMQANFVSGPNTITVPSGVYLLTRPGTDGAALVGDLDITDELTVQGAGSSATICVATRPARWSLQMISKPLRLTSMSTRHEYAAE
jgi:CSLREA domain-containing protein